jgi:hypothetical protein
MVLLMALLLVSGYAETTTLYSDAGFNVTSLNSGSNITQLTGYGAFNPTGAPSIWTAGGVYHDDTSALTDYTGDTTVPYWTPTDDITSGYDTVNITFSIEVETNTTVLVILSVNDTYNLYVNDEVQSVNEGQLKLFNQSSVLNFTIEVTHLGFSESDDGNYGVAFYVNYTLPASPALPETSSSNAYIYIIVVVVLAFVAIAA